MTRTTAMRTQTGTRLTRTESSRRTTRQLLRSRFFVPALEPLESRIVLTDQCGIISNVDVTWRAADSPHRLVCEVYVRDGANLTIEAGAVVTQQSSDDELYIGDNGTAGSLTADGVTFHQEIIFGADGGGAIENSTIATRYIHVRPGAEPVLSGNLFHDGKPLAVDLHYAPTVVNNIFANGATIGLFGGVVRHDLFWPAVPNGVRYELMGDVFVRDGATLTLEQGVSLTQQTNADELYIGDNGTTGTLNANGVLLNQEVIFGPDGGGAIQNSTIASRYVHVRPGGNPLLSNNLFHGGRPLVVDIQYPPQLVDNTFDEGATIELLGGVVDDDITWPAIPNATRYELTDEVFVRDGATLTIERGVSVSQQTSADELYVGDNGTTGTLKANGVTFRQEIIFGPDGGGSIEHSTIASRHVEIRSGAEPLLLDNLFHSGTPVVTDGHYIPQLVGNTFEPGATIAVLSGSISRDVAWPFITNASRYELGDLVVRNGATLVLKAGVTIAQALNGTAMSIGVDGSEGILRADGVTLDQPVVFGEGSIGVVENSILLQTVRIASGADLSVKNSDFSGLSMNGVQVFGDSTQTIDLTDNWWGTTDSTSIEETLLHRVDDSTRPLVDFEPYLATGPQKIDLVITSVDVPLEGFAGQTVPISWSLRNLGDDDAQVAFTDRLVLSPDRLIGSDIVLGSFDFTGTIRANETVVRSQRVRIPDGLSGPLFLAVVTDAGNGVYEHNGEDNNTSFTATPINIRHLPQPDLIVTSLTVPPEAFSEQEIVVSWLVENVGDGATSVPIWHDYVYLSDDPQLNPADDQLLGFVTNSSYLNPGQSYANRLAVSLPRGVEGDHYLIVLTDARAVVDELGSVENNSAAGGPIDVHLTPPPDLTVSSVVSPPLGLSGELIFVRWTVANQGPADIEEESWRDSIYLSRDGQLDAADTRLGSVTNASRVVVNDSYTTEQAFVLPSNADGMYQIIVATDSDDSVYEHFEEDNNVRAGTTVLAVTPVRSDLEVLVGNVPTIAGAGTQFTVPYRVENRGVAITPGANWNDAAYLSADSIFNPNDDQLVGVRANYTPLKPDEGYDAALQVSLPVDLSGIFYLYVVADATDAVLELNEDNNAQRSVTTMNVQHHAADLIARLNALPLEASAGSTLLASWSVVNQGTNDTLVDRWSSAVYLSSDEIVGNTDDRLLARRNYASVLSAGETAETRNFPILIPLDVDPGSYGMYVVSDDSNRVYEGENETNNATEIIPISIHRSTANLEIATIAIPEAAESGAFIEVTWTGANSGEATTEAFYWHDAIFLSDDRIVSPDDKRLGAKQLNNTLDPGESYTRTVVVQLPSGLEGEYFLYVAADVDNRVLEAPSESDNLRFADAALVINSSAAPSLPPPDFIGPRPGPDPLFAPDLRVTLVDAPSSAVSGQSIGVSWTVENEGYDAAGWEWADAVYLSLDQVFDPASDVSLGFRNRPTADLPADSAYSQTAEFVVPPGMAGPYYVFVLADAGHRIPEVDETKNAHYDKLSMFVDLPNPAELVVGSITIPEVGTAGQAISVTYRVDNLGPNAAIGVWTDSLYLSNDPEWDIDDVPIGSLQHSANVPGGEGYSKTLEAPIPGVLPGNYHVIVRSDIRNQIPEGSESNNIEGSLEHVVVGLNSLVVGVPSTGSLAENQGVFYRIEVPGGETLKLSFDSVSDSAANELYLSFGTVPSRTEYDARFDDAFEPDQQILVPVTQAGIYYILAYGDRVDVPAADYTIEAEILDFSIESIDVARGSNQGPVTLSVTGAKLTSQTAVSLEQDGAPLREAKRVWWIDDSTLWASFDLHGLDVGQYDVRIFDGSQADVLDAAFQVTSGRLGSVAISVETPSRLLPGQSGFATLRYANVGETDVVPSVIQVDATNANLLGNGELSPSNNTVTFLSINPDGPAGILPPGSEHSILIPFQPTTDSGEVEVRASDLGDGESILNWDPLQETLRPPGVQDDGWAVVWNRFRQSVGRTVDDLQSNLSDNATYLSQLGVYTMSVARLMTFELTQADNVLPNTTLLDSVDASAIVPGLPLVFGRTVHQNITGRYALGAFGRGWTHSWDYQATTHANGDVLIWANGSVRSFLQRPDGAYQGLPGDNVLRLTLS